MSSGALVDDGAPTPRGKWVSVGSEQFSTMAEGKDNLKMMEGGKWKWDKSPGDGRTQSCFRCNAHVDCDRVLRVHLVDGFFIIEGKGEHAPDPNLKRRLNSTLTFDMETRVRVCILFVFWRILAWRGGCMYSTCILHVSCSRSCILAFEGGYTHISVS